MLRPVLIVMVLLINLFAYAIMWYDKRQAIARRRRVPEKRLFLIAALLGAPGIYLGMKKPLYHKAAQSKFIIGIPVLMVANAFALYFLW